MFIQLLRWPGKGVLWLYWICPNRCWPSMDSDGNTLIGLGRCEQKTLYQGPRSIWKQRVNYKQQGLSTICSALNDVILTLKLPEAHLLRSVFCSVKYPLAQNVPAVLVCMATFSLPLHGSLCSLLPTQISEGHDFQRSYLQNICYFFKNLSSLCLSFYPDFLKHKAACSDVHTPALCLSLLAANLTVLV